MKKAVKLLTLAIMSSTILFSSSAHGESNADERYIYTGLELGLSTPAINSFKKDIASGIEAKIKLNHSNMLGGKIGYGFYPDMRIEISGTHQPSYKMTYIIDGFKSKQNIPIPPGTTVSVEFDIPKAMGITHVTSNVYTANFIYLLNNLKFSSIKPYIIGGAGIADLTVKQSKFQYNTSDIKFSLPGVKTPVPATSALGRVQKIDGITILKTKTTAPVFQFGLGFAFDITSQLEADISAKLQIIKDIRLDYQVFNFTTKALGEKKRIKQSVANGEFALGLTYKLDM